MTTYNVSTSRELTAQEAEVLRVASAALAAVLPADVNTEEVVGVTARAYVTTVWAKGRLDHIDFRVSVEVNPHE